MNLAFAALVILVLATPGFAFIYAFRIGHGRPRTSRPIADDLPLAFAATALLHTAWGFLFNCIGTAYFNTKVYPEAALMLLTNVYGSSGNKFQAVSDALLKGWHPLYLATYLATICIVAGVIGVGFRWVIDATRIDRWIPTLRSNDWYYLLRGETPEGDPLGQGDEAVQFTALAGDYIYWGLVFDYFVAADGSLDAVVLAIPKRRKIGDGEDVVPIPSEFVQADIPYHEIDVDYLVLRCSECTNFGVRLVYLAGAPTPKKPSLRRWIGVKLKQLGHVLSHPPFSEPYRP